MTEKKKEITERLEREFDVCDKHISLFQIAGFHGSKNIPIYIGISG